MHEVVEFIRVRIAAYKNRTNLPGAAPASAADEIKKYKELLDMGAISQNEYEAKKKQLLGL